MRHATVPADIQLRIQLKIQEGIRKIHDKYKVTLPSPRITYDVAGTTAGKAISKTWTIALNSGLLMLHTEQFIERTPLHELGHLACYKIYPETLAARGLVRAGNGFKRAKREVHGPRWQEIMSILDREGMSRTHSFDTSMVKKQTDQSTFEYKCMGCGEQVKLTARRHAKVTATYFYRHRCAARGMLVFAGIANIAPAPSARPVTSTMKAPTGDSKLAQCWKLYNDYASRSRSWMIPVFVNEAGCTPAGAATYYSLCKRMYEAGVM
jgi:predicted SprT family Zn-dependent metalloprotease